MRVAVTYHRVSTRDQNPELASAELRHAAELRGLELRAQVVEQGSGRRNDRPGLAAVMEMARRGRISHVLVWKLDRFGRSALDLLTNARELVQSGVTLVSTTQGFEVGPSSGALGTLVLSVLAAVAELESEMISERTRLGLVEAAKKGRFPGRPRKVQR